MTYYLIKSLKTAKRGFLRLEISAEYYYFIIIVVTNYVVEFIVLNEPFVLFVFRQEHTVDAASASRSRT